MLKSFESHLGLCNLDVSFGTSILCSLHHASSFSRHYWMSSFQIFQVSLLIYLFLLRNWNGRHSHTFGLNDASFECRVIDLLELRRVVSTLCIDVVSQ